MTPSTRTIRSSVDLKQVVSDYLNFGEFAFDIETVATRPSRALHLEVEEAPKGISRIAVPMLTCPSCWREFPKGHGRIFCSDVCRQAAEKDKPALDARTNKVWCVSLAGPGRSDVIPCWHPGRPKEQQLEAREVFDALEPLFFSDRRKIGHNVGFDLTSIAKYYKDKIPPPPYGDTLTLIYLLNENRLKYNLGVLAMDLLHCKYSEKLGEKAYTADWNDAVRYSMLDAKYAWMLWWKFHPNLSWRSLRKLDELFELEMEVLGVLMAMRQKGAYVEVEEFRRLRLELEARHKGMKVEIKKMVGYDINLNSPVQLAHYLYDELPLKCPKLTDKGARSTDAQTLKTLSRRHSAPGKLLEFKDLQKLLSTYIAGYIPHIDDDRRIRASFNQARAKTGRLSCSDPNLQNIPARYKETFEATMVRQLFRAPEGKKLIVADYSQIELRILAHMTRDAKLMYAYSHGLDLHTQTAALIWKVSQDEVTPTQRSIAKNCNFNFAFEGGPQRVMDMSGISLSDAEKVYEGWHKAYPGVKKWGDQIKQFCWDNGYVETLYGRRRRLKEICSDDWKLRSYAQRQAVNHPIQGTAADIAKIAIVQVHQALQGHDAALVLQIHDEFVIEVAQGQVFTVLPLVRTAMEDIRLGSRPVLDVPLEATINVGNNWAEAK